MKAFIEVETSERTFKTLKPALLTVPDKRSDISIAYEERRLVLEIEAEDVSAMRAALNTWLRLVKVAVETPKL